MNDVVAMGELLIDFIQNDTGDKGTPIFEANPGGAPCNVLAMLSRLGYSTAFIGKVGMIISGGCLGKQSGKRGFQMKGCCMTVM